MKDNPQGYRDLAMFSIFLVLIPRDFKYLPESEKEQTLFDVTWLFYRDLWSGVLPGGRCGDT